MCIILLVKSLVMVRRGLDDAPIAAELQWDPDDDSDRDSDANVAPVAN